MLLSKLNSQRNRFLHQALIIPNFHLSSISCCVLSYSNLSRLPVMKRNINSSHPRTILGDRNIQATQLNCASLDTINKASCVKPRDQLLVAVEGNIGAGKSTLLKHLSQYKNEIDVIMEPVDDWCNVSGTNMLELLYSDPKRWCFAFNSNAMLARMKMHCDNNSQKPIKIIERSLYATRHVFVEQSFQAGNIHDIELAMLDELFHSLRRYCNVKLDKIVYLRADPEVCLHRIKKRGRKEESNLSLEFLTSLHLLYDEWLLRRSSEYGIPVVTVDCNLNVHDNIEDIYKSLHCENTNFPPESLKHNFENSHSIVN